MLKNLLQPVFGAREARRHRRKPALCKEKKENKSMAVRSTTTLHSVDWV